MQKNFVQMLQEICVPRLFRVEYDFLRKLQLWSSAVFVGDFLGGFVVSVKFRLSMQEILRNARVLFTS